LVKDQEKNGWVLFVWRLSCWYFYKVFICSWSLRRRKGMKKFEQLGLREGVKETLIKLASSIAVKE
jgi:hypothetical protein